MSRRMTRHVKLEQSLLEILNEGLRVHREGRLDDAEKSYLKVLDRDPRNFDALNLLGMLKQQRGLLGEARRWFEGALEARPASVAALNNLTATLLALGDGEAAANKALAALALEPDDPVASYQLGSAWQVLGETEKAALALEKALALKPDFPDALSMLGIVRHRQGRFPEAVKCLNEALRQRPGHPDYLNNLGFVLLASRRPAQALPFLQQAVAGQANFGEALVNLGRALHQLGRDDEAIEVFTKAGEIDRKVAAIPVNLGISLHALGRSDDAEQAYKRALELAPDNALALANLATLYESTNRLEAAEKTARRGLALVPEDPFLNLVMAKCERRAGDLAVACQRLQDLIESSDDKKWHQALAYELARSEDRAGHPDKAMAAARNANNLALDHWRSLGESDNSYNQMVKAFAEHTAGGWIEGWRPLSPGQGDRLAPVFLVGFPRSGTTLLDTIIGSHPDYLVLEEKPALERIRLQLEHAPGGFFAAVSALDEEGRSALVDSYWRDAENMLGEAIGQRRLLDKLPLNIVLLPLIARLFPDARIIVMLRHPADACLSCFFQEFDYLRATAMTNFFTMQDTVRFYDDVMRLWQGYETRLPLAVFKLRYEDLVEDIECETRRLFEFLDSPFNPVVLEFHSQSAARRTIDTPSYHQVSQPLYSSSVYRWRRYAKQLRPWLEQLLGWADIHAYQRSALAIEDEGSNA